MDTEALRDVLDRDGPFASVYFDASHDTEDAAKEVELRWRAVRDRLLALDAPKPTIEALGSAVAERPPAVGRTGRFLVAAGDRVCLDEYLTVPPAEPEVRLSPLPYLLPLIEAGRQVPYVVVRVGKTGGRMWGVASEAVIRREVRGREHPVHKVRGGGWAHRSMRRRTEEIVKQNLDEVAAEATRLAGRIGARLVVLVGDVEPRALLRHELPASVALIAVEADAEGDAERLAAQVWHAEQAAAVDRFRSELSRENLAVQGIAATATALREANVELLVINTDAVHKHEVWTATQPNLVATDRSELHDLGFSERAQLPADEALPAAALAVGADVLTVDEDVPADGVGALLRHT